MKRVSLREQITLSMVAGTFEHFPYEVNVRLGSRTCFVLCSMYQGAFPASDAADAQSATTPKRQRILQRAIFARCLALAIIIVVVNHCTNPQLLANGPALSQRGGGKSGTIGGTYSKCAAPPLITTINPPDSSVLFPFTVLPAKMHESREMEPIESFVAHGW